MSKLTKFLAVTLAVTTTLWLSGVAMFAPTPEAQAVTVEEGDLIRGPDGIKVFIVNENGFKRHIFNPEVFNMYGHLTWESIKDVSQATLDSYETSDLYRQAGKKKVYQLEEVDEAAGNAVKHWLDVSAQQFVDAGYSWNQNFTVNGKEVEYYSTGDPITEGDLDTDQPSDYTDQTSCEDADYYWYNDSCNAEAQTAEGFQVKLADDNPASANVPMHAQSVEYLRFDLSADKDVEVSSITFTRDGIGSKDDFNKVWLEDMDGVMVSDGRSVNTSDEVTLRPGLTVEGGETETYSLMADLADSTNGNIDSLKINTPSDVDSDADSVGGSFSVEGNQMSITSYDIADVTFSSEGSNSTVDVGANEAIVGEFSVNPKSNNNQDSVFESVRLKEKGSGDLDDLDNIALYDQDGNVVSDDSVVDGNYLTFSDVNYDIEDGDTEKFSVRADVVGGDDGDTIIFTLNNNYELFVRENQFNFGGNVSGAADLKTYTLNAGKFAVTLDSSSPSNQEVAPDTSQVTGLIARADLDQDVEVDGLDVYLETNSSISGGTAGSNESGKIDAEVEDVRLYAGGTLVDSVDSVTDAGGSDDGDIAADEFYYDFSSSFSLSDDDLIKVTFDVKSAASSSDVYKLTFSNSGASSNFSSPEYVDSGETVATADKSGSVTGNKITITSGSVTATRNDGYPASHVFIAGTNDAKVFQFVLEAGVASKIDVSKLDFGISSVTDDSLYTNSELYAGKTKDGEKLGDTTDFDSTYARFESLNYEIPAGDVQTFSLFTDIDTSASDSGVEFELDASDSLFYDKENNEVTMANNATSTTINVNSQGTLTVSADAEPTSDVLPAVTSNGEVSLGSWTLVAEDDAIDITDLYFANDPVASDSASSTADSNIEALKLYVDGEMVGSGKPLTSGTVHFNLGSTNAFTVPKDGTAELEAKADLNKITDTSQTNKRVELAFWSLSAEGTGGTSLTSVSGMKDGTLDGGTYDSHSSAPVANEFVVTRTRPTLASNSSEADTGSAPNGTTKVYAFDVSAADSGAVSFKKLILTVSGTASSTSIGSGTTSEIRDFMTTSSQKVYRGTTEKTASFTAATTTITIEFSNVQTVSAGDTVTYVYETELSGFDLSSGSSDYIETTIKSSSPSYAAADTYTNASSSGNFIWADNSGTYEQTGSSHWINEYLFDELDLGKVKIDA